MPRRTLYTEPDLVEIYWDVELAAIWLKWFDEFDEGSRVRDAVIFALDYATQNDVKHWVGDLAVSRRGLSARDQAWVESDFQSRVLAAPLEKLVLIPPRPETGQDISWLDAWEESARQKFGRKIETRLLSEFNDIRRFFSG